MKYDVTIRTVEMDQDGDPIEDVFMSAVDPTIPSQAAHPCDLFGPVAAWCRQNSIMPVAIEIEREGAHD